MEKSSKPDEIMIQEEHTKWTFTDLTGVRNSDDERYRTSSGLSHLLQAHRNIRLLWIMCMWLMRSTIATKYFTDLSKSLIHLSLEFKIKVSRFCHSYNIFHLCKKIWKSFSGQQRINWKKIGLLPNQRHSCHSSKVVESGPKITPFTKTNIHWHVSAHTIIWQHQCFAMIQCLNLLFATHQTTNIRTTITVLHSYSIEVCSGRLWFWLNLLSLFIHKWGG